jgi:hypothetical protein
MRLTTTKLLTVGGCSYKEKKGDAMVVDKNWKYLCEIMALDAYKLVIVT